MASTSHAHIATQKKAPVWVFFEPPFEESGKEKAKCHLCLHDKYLIITCGSTTSLRNHIINIHHIDIFKAGSSDDLTSLVPQSNESIFREALVKWIASKSLLFTTVKLESFQELVRLIKVLGDIEVPSANNSSKEVESQVLDLVPFEEAHTGVNLLNTLVSICNEFGIIDKILGITVNNASSNNTLLEAFEAKCKNVEPPDQDEDELSILEELTTSQTLTSTPIIKKLRTLIAKIQSSPQRRNKLRELSIDRMASEVRELNNLGLSESEWNMLKEVSLPLKSFCDMSEVLCDETYVIMSLVIPAYNQIMDDLEDIQDKSSIAIHEAIEQALGKLIVYYTKSGGPAYAVTTLLDLRFKKAYYETEGWDAEWISWATESLNDVYN
ncbi:10018_t:CDS:2 [Ambispora leptoticha]|uniref:10018_t:CDS:1 n=1 Tax=Ambispora leptoticha TaxID=144679 RepID=A0A9N9B508_9GLOM|nr:10018_t:CDS:2 [Ambispora leptoticha]